MTKQCRDKRSVPTEVAVIRRATKNDLAAVNNLLRQVLGVHADIRPDIFEAGTKKYTDEELLAIFEDDETPVFVYEDECGYVCGHAFCIKQHVRNVPNMHDADELYIDDICVDEKCRGKHIATALYEYVCDFARSEHFTRVTLNVWEGNDSARSFYEHMGMRPRKTYMEQDL